MGGGISGGIMDNPLPPAGSGEVAAASCTGVCVAGSSPTPLNDAVCVPALSAMLKLPVRVPEAVGRNATDTVHPTPPASVVPHVFTVIAKSPVTTGGFSPRGNACCKAGAEAAKVML